MDEFGSEWVHRERVEELKKKLIQATYELELERYKAYERSGKHLEDINGLIQVWKMALDERDEAKKQLQTLLENDDNNDKNSKNKNYMSNNSTLPSTTTNTQNNKFIGIPDDVIADVVSTPEPNASMAGSSHSVSSPYNHPGSLIIDRLVKGKTLPKQGKLMQALLEAGPLLESFMVAGPLPKWQNPPPTDVLPVSFYKFVGKSGTRVGGSRPFAHEPKGLTVDLIL